MRAMSGRLKQIPTKQKMSPVYSNALSFVSVSQTLSENLNSLTAKASPIKKSRSFAVVSMSAKQQRQSVAGMSVKRN